MPDGVRGGDGQWWWYHSRAGIISQRFGITCTSQSLLLQSISPLLLSLCVYITRITLFVMSSLIPPPVHAHIPYCVFLLSGPGSDCPQTHAPFPPSPHFCILPRIEYSSLQFHFRRYTTKRYIIKRNNKVLTLLSMHSGYVPGQTAVLQFIELF